MSNIDSIFVDVKIMARRERRGIVLDMVERLNSNEASVVVYDDRKKLGNAMYNARRTWKSSLDGCATHRLVLQDDLELCDNFRLFATTCAKAFPKAIWSLFQPRFSNENEVDIKVSAYHKIRGCGMYGQAIMMPVEYINSVFEFVDKYFGKDYPYDDNAIGWFAYTHNIPVMTTVPSLVQHICPNKSLLGFNNKNKVSKAWEGPEAPLLKKELFETREIESEHYVVNGYYVKPKEKEIELRQIFKKLREESSRRK